MTIQDMTAYAENLDNWRKTRAFAKEQEHFTLAQLKTLFAKREQHAGLSHCYKVVGKTGYVNVPLFGLWMAGLLPEQQES